MGDAWTREENEAIIAEYFAMLEQELAGQSFVKARSNARVRAATGRGREWPMFVSRNEVAVSRAEADRYVLARVFDFARPRVGLFELTGAIEDTCLLEPETYRALPRAG